MSFSGRDIQSIWHPFTQAETEPAPTAIVRGEGALLFDENGNAYIDAISSWWVNLHGHSHPYIAEKVCMQLRTLEHVIFAGFTHPPAIELAERLLKVLPENQKRIFYSDNGSTAVEVALKMALQYWHNGGQKRTTIIAFRNSYHGDTFGAMAVGARGAFNIPFEPLLFDVKFIDAPEKGKENQSLSQLLQLLEDDNVAALIYEPLVQASGGMIMQQAKGLENLLKACKEAGVITIADEVFTGLYRTGKFFASENMIVVPDIMCLSKGLTGGTMAMGVTSCTADIYNAFLSQDKMKAFYHGHSYTANPLACAAALASLDLLEKRKCVEDILRIINKHSGFAKELINIPKVKNIRQLGTIIAFDIITEGQAGYFNNIASWLKAEFLKRNVILRPLGNTVYILPPYCITSEQLEKVYDAIIDVLNLLK